MSDGALTTRPLVGPHLRAAGVAIAILVAAVALMVGVARWEARRQLHDLAPRALQQKTQGRALQVEALGQRDLLVLYGSSEFGRTWGWELHRLFRDNATGFLPFTVARAGATSLVLAQSLASAGVAVRDRSIALSVSPQWFTYRLAPDAKQYAGVFSPLHATAFAFDSPLSARLKRHVARRMLEYPDTLEGRPVLRLGLERLADRGVVSRLAYYGLWPLGKLESLLLGLQDHWETLVAVRSESRSARPPGPPTRAVDWEALLGNVATALQTERARQHAADQDRPRVDVVNQRGRPIEPIYDHVGVGDRIRRGREWEDFGLLLRVLGELGARPLLLVMPLNGPHYEARGVPYATRAAYYAKVREVVGPYGFAVADFSGLDGDPDFLRDYGGHPSRLGWVHYARAMDRFYHAGRS